MLGLGYRTGQVGEELVYRHGAAAAYVQGAGGAATARAPTARHAHHDDDD